LEMVKDHKVAFKASTGKCQGWDIEVRRVETKGVTAVAIASRRTRFGGVAFPLVLLAIPAAEGIALSAPRCM
jgi:hypothetical protein